MISVALDALVHCIAIFCKTAYSIMPVSPQTATVRISFFSSLTRFFGNSVSAPRISVATTNRTAASVSGGYVV